ncbi:unnamed protein product [Cyprideis torosa]|uniref:Uncharacterized protein n=1 Tax=Cyprideis torosa TaxID=163714 RepID=A0A7R8W999_9CRUS|nr:unnamed protein product [Cyprideis torosa]CAG0889554.1 unnamed protein product [Cyprideis torosa]
MNDSHIMKSLVKPEVDDFLEMEVQEFIMRPTLDLLFDMIFAVFLVSALALANGQNLEINDYETWLDYLGDGYRGIVVASDGTQSLLFSVMVGSRDIDVSAPSDLAFSSRFVLLPEGTMAVQGIVLSSDSTGILYTYYLSLPDFQVIQSEQEELLIGDTARLYVAAGSEPEPAVYVTYDSIKEAIQSGTALLTAFDGTACTDNHPELDGQGAVAANVDIRIVNEGTAEEYIAVVLSTVDMLSETSAGPTWNEISIAPDGRVFLLTGSFDPNGGTAEVGQYLCNLGTSWAMRDIAGFPDGGRQITTLEGMTDQLLSGLPTAMVLDTTQCEVQGDDDIIGASTYIQRRAISNWLWSAENPGGTGEAIQVNYFHFGGEEDPYVIHENIDIDVNNAYIHLSLIDLKTQTWNTTVLVCGLGTGAWMESKTEGQRTQLTSVEEVVEAAGSGYTTAISVSLAACTDENGDPGEDQILGSSAIYSYARGDAVYATNDFTMRLNPASFDGFAFASYRASLAEDGTLTLQRALHDAGDWTLIAGDTLTCPFAAAVVWK